MNGQAAFLLRGKEVKSVALSGTLIQAFQLGKAILNAQQNNMGVITAILDHFGGNAKVLFKGQVSKLDAYEKEGYFYGENHIAGSDEYAGKHYRIGFKNEHMQSWVDGKPHVSCPDFICIIDSLSGVPLLNGRIELNQAVTVIGIVCDKKLRTDQALQWLAPRYFGYDFEYRPLAF